MFYNQPEPDIPFRWDPDDPDDDELKPYNNR